MEYVEVRDPSSEFIGFLNIFELDLVLIVEHSNNAHSQCLFFEIQQDINVHLLLIEVFRVDVSHDFVGRTPGSVASYTNNTLP